MKNRIFVTILSLFTVCVFSVPVLAQVVEPAEIEYSAVFGSLAAIVAIVPIVVETIKAMIPKLPPLVTQILSWAVGVAICMFGWWKGIGFLSGLDWYIALLYGLGSGLAANGIADTGLIDFVVSLFKKKKA